jgi:ribonuclease P protein component
MLTQTAKSIFKKMEPLDGNSIRHAFASRMAIRVHTPSFSLNVFKSPNESLPNDPSLPSLDKSSQQPVLHYRASVITGKKALGKSAVARNRARRRILSAAQHSFSDCAIPGKFGTLRVGVVCELFYSR